MRREMGGADGITVHLREDRRHIQDRGRGAAAGSGGGEAQPGDGGDGGDGGHRVPPEAAHGDAGARGARRGDDRGSAPCSSGRATSPHGVQYWELWPSSSERSA